ncbi:MAG: hypothetical protein JXB88_17375 [Spirochaetales bacterium]|nr:hypothetical protein [Spirochaetales bacterium]
MEIEGLQFFRQEKLPICVLCSVMTILNKYGKKYQLNELIKNLEVNVLHGVDLIDLIYFLIKEGFKTFPFIRPVNEITPLLDENWPLLIWMQKKNGMHTCVVYGYGNNEDTDSLSFVLFDPLEGRIEMLPDVIDTAGPDIGFSHYCYYLLIVNESDFILKQPKIGEFITNDAFYYNIEGEIYYYYKNDSDKALDCWKKALSIKDDYAEVYNNLSILYSKKLSLLDESVKYAKKACDLNREDPTFKITLGELYLCLNDKISFFSLIKEIEQKWTRNIDILKLKKKGEMQFGKIN